MSKKEAHALKIHRGFIGVSYSALCVGKGVSTKKIARLRGKEVTNVRVGPANG